MAEVKLNYEGLVTKAKAIRKQREEFDALLKRIMQTIGGVKEVWSDKAADDFISKVQQSQKEFQKFSEALDGLEKHMTNVSAKYAELSTSVISAQKF
ncbi:WXG100 family type VII secretion target [Paenibacillus herberti]|uniref:ESAT-6-like protein n=1 Tax=Paenibacillus herberti TaxID=1619309 RepID=A0A229P0T6_9BACL|nr:WXG100 family type VII secretion target [Paenibacillus herberti]OXM15554.1 hypothetical protein CGZ75_02105 [Paenibacillus herberti]